MKNRAYWCSKSFYDPKKFPYGFSRSGVFTYKESELLESKGHLFKALINEQVFDPSIEDLKFTRAFISGDYFNSFETRVWWKYVYHQRQLISIAGSWHQLDKNFQSVNDNDFKLENIDSDDWGNSSEGDDILEAC